MVGEYPTADSISEFRVLLLSSVRLTYWRMSSGFEDRGDSPRSAASDSAFWQAKKICCATKRARSSPWRSTCWVRRPRYRAETTVTTPKTRSEVASVNLVFRLRRIFPPRLVFFQLVVKCL